GRSAVPGAVHRRGQGGDYVDPAGLPAVGSEPDGSGAPGFLAAQFPYAEGQRAHGRRALDRGIRMVDRKPAEPDHRQDPVAHAFAYADGREADQLGTALAPEDRVSATTAVLPNRAPMDPQLHEIYSKETSSHLAEIRDYLHKRMGQPAPHDLPESVYRAIHTLSGSSKMAEARHGIR